ncbi:MAG: hypothetical protein RSA01_03090 [Clostridium sp.]|uniref:hypothetical protein n=1 Tax=Clostridium sp. TaxID=1506 RepID=UPI002FCC533A
MSRSYLYGDLNDERAIMRTGYRNMPSGCVNCKYKTLGSSGTSQCKVCSIKLMSKNNK